MDHFTKTVVAKFPQMISLKNILAVVGIWSQVLEKFCNISNYLLFSVLMKNFKLL